MSIYRVITSMLVIDGRLLMTLSCRHTFSFPIGYFRSKPIPTNGAGQQVYRCQVCEDDHAKEIARR